MIERLPSGKYRVRWYEAGRSAGRRSRTFERRRDARVFEAELTRRRALGEFAYLEAANKRVEDLAKDWWEIRQAQPGLQHAGRLRPRARQTRAPSARAGQAP